jgi:peptidyl-dipeptidase Dcp
MERRTFLASSAALAASPSLSGAAFAQTPASAALLAAWTGPFGGVPAFDKVEVAAFKPALEAAMARELAEIEAICADAAPATFENTIAALERRGAESARVGAVYAIWAGTLSTPAFRAVEQEMQPKLAAHGDKIQQNPRLFARIDAVYQKRAALNLTPEQLRLTELTWNGFVRNGAKLAPKAKARVAALNGELAKAFTAFNQTLLHAEPERDLFLPAAGVAGLPDDVREATPTTTTRSSAAS